MKYSTALSGNTDLNSPYNCAANVLLCDNISVGFCTFWITFAIVKVFPDPVMPNSDWSLWLSFSPFTRESIAFGWSPKGLYFEVILKPEILS